MGHLPGWGGAGNLELIVNGYNKLMGSMTQEEWGLMQAKVEMVDEALEEVPPGPPSPPDRSDRPGPAWPDRPGRPAWLLSRGVPGHARTMGS
jgi:hypothetical protein